uniref:Gamma-glutamyltransferase n=1 Tax=Branchiostoma floridae TaxID=7739 RepID=C3XV42_BRAFL|eukprot:XP_002611959.1 hypothetical protein BRAFLDRAFT_91843 [Branchiostoma floridae]
MQVIAKHLYPAVAAFLAAYAAHIYLSRPDVPAPAGGRCHDARPSDRDAAGGPYRHGAVASDSAQCSRIGRDTLMNGSAVDAAIATILCLGVVHPQSLGLGGGFVMTVYTKDTGTSQVINALETAPLASSEDMFAENPDLATMGGISVAVPGQVRGLWEAHQRYGKLPWRDLFLPAIQLAEEGTCIGKHLAIAMRVKEADILDRKYGLCDVFCDEHGTMLRENTTVRRPQLAKTLLAVANGGADAFYTGEIAKNLVKDIHNHGYGLNSSAREGVQNQVLTYHRMLEAYKFGFAHWMELGDPNFVNVEKLTKRMVSKDFADELRRKIDDTRTFDSSYYGLDVPSQDISGTSHVSVLGPNGDAVAVTSSIGRYFGARFRSLSTGIILNNHMELYTLRGENGSTRISSKSPGYAVQPGKRGKTLMSPTVVLNSSGDVRLVIGGSGGYKLMTGLTDEVLHELEKMYGKAVPEWHQAMVQAVAREDLAISGSAREDSAISGSAREDSAISGSAREDSAISGSAREDSAIFAHSDSRKGGFPAGF